MKNNKLPPTVAVCQAMRILNPALTCAALFKIIGKNADSMGAVYKYWHGSNRAQVAPWVGRTVEEQVASLRAAEKLLNAATTVHVDATPYVTTAIEVATAKLGVL